MATRILLRALALIGLSLALASCGGGGGGGGGGSASSGGSVVPTPPPTITNNSTPIILDGGPPEIVARGGAYNEPFVSVTVCAPGSITNCQTVDHVLLDTGSVGLRIVASVLNTSLLSALPTEADASGNPVGECYQFIDGYVFGSVRKTDFTLGGGQVAGLPIQVIGDGGAFSSVPASCSSGGGTLLNTVGLFGANGVLGVGVTATDCGTLCAASLSQGSAIYYDCPSSGCGAVTTRAAATIAPFQQLPNPVAAFSSDNNGTLIVLPAVDPGGAATLTGTLYFGIGTQADNALSGVTVIGTTTTNSPHGAGLITTLYNGQSLVQSFIDSGSSDLFFVDSNITPCSNANLAGYYCPSSPVNLALTIQGQNGASVSFSQTLNSAQPLLSTTNAAVPGTGYNPSTNKNFTNTPSSFDFGIPFFYGRRVYTAIEGRSAGGVNGPYVAF
jgi:hypothetical protein